MRHRTTHQPVIEDKEGNLYYVRLKTSLGPMYKLGFTTMASVKERLAFQGAGHEDQIDKVIAFVPDPGALSIEQRLHRHFKRHSVFPVIERDMPFAGNGQSELYVEDILEMDFEYTPEQGRRVHEALMQGRMAQTGASPASIATATKQKLRDNEDVQAIIDLRHLWLVRWVLWARQKLVDRLFTSPAQREHEKDIQRLIEWFQREPRRQRAIENVRLKRELAEIEDRHRRAAAQRTFAGKLAMALEALKSRDLWAFEMLVDLDRLAMNLAEAMTEDLVMGSDYMGVACNCGLVELCDAMADGNPIEMLTVPVKDGYKELLRHWVAKRELRSEDLVMPTDPIYYRTDDGTVHEVSPLSSLCYGPSNFLNIFGRQWRCWLEQPAMVEDDWAAFKIEIANEQTGFRGDLLVHAMQFESAGRINVAFPNFHELYEQALHASNQHESRGNANLDNL